MGVAYIVYKFKIFYIDIHNVIGPLMCHMHDGLYMNGDDYDEYKFWFLLKFFISPRLIGLSKKPLISNQLG